MLMLQRDPVQKELNTLCQAKVLAKTSEGALTPPVDHGPTRKKKATWSAQATSVLFPLTTGTGSCGSRVLSQLLHYTVTEEMRHHWGNMASDTQKSVSWPGSAFTFIRKGWVTCEEKKKKKSWPCKGIPKEWHICLLSINTNSHGDMVLWC